MTKNGRARRKETVEKPISYKEVRDEVRPWLAQRIKSRMDQLGLTQPKLEKATGIGASTISDYVTGKCEPTFSKLVVLSKALKVKWDYFLYEDDL